MGVARNGRRTELELVPHSPGLACQGILRRGWWDTGERVVQLSFLLAQNLLVTMIIVGVEGKLVIPSRPPSPVLLWDCDILACWARGINCYAG